MKRRIAASNAALKAAMLAALLFAVLLMGMTAAAEGYRPAAGNEKNLGKLLVDLVNAYEKPRADDGARIDADLEAVRSVNGTDYDVASAIADHWRAVFLDDGYVLNMYAGSGRADALEASGMRDGDIDAIVVLGYELKDGKMTKELMGRCEAAAEVARSFPGAILVCSGGATGENNPKKYTEAGLMKAYLTRKCGIDGDRIFIDERAMTTLENAVNTFAILEQQGIRTMTIVTSSYHQRWGQAVYNAVGAIYRLDHGYAAEIVSNYCYDIEPSHDSFRHGDRFAARQIGAALGLPNEVLDGIKR